MKKSKWIYLSYKISDDLSAYGNGKRSTIYKERSIDKGDSTNNSVIKLPAHFGTHIDFPFHFSINGKMGEEYDAKYFIFNEVEIIHLNIDNILNYQLSIKDFSNYKFCYKTELLLIKTGMQDYRSMDEYWNSNPSFSPDLAKYFKEQMPDLRCIGFDTISLTGWKYRNIGKEAHKEFLIENNILIIEDMKLDCLNSNSYVQKILISPLRYKKSDGSSLTVFAKVF